MVKNWSSDSEADSDGSCYSDQIDSDIEAELYSSIHHEANTSACEIAPNEELYNVDDNLNEKNTDLNDNCVAEQENDNDTILIEENARFSSDLTFNSNLYTNFESPPKRCVVNEIFVNKKGQNSKKSRKRKSDVSVDSLENTQIGFESVSNSSIGQNNVSIERTEKCLTAAPNKNNSKIQIVEEQLSDTDSSVVLAEPEMDLSLQTNIEEMIVISSDGDDSSVDENELLFSRIGNSTCLSTPSSSNSKDPWHINEDDLYRRRKSSSRYHEKAALYCSNCNQKGHLVKFCPQEKETRCFICGGKHSGTSCRHKVCYKCFQMGHDPRYCSRHFNGICDHCNMMGHLPEDCPDLWRRYHRTTEGVRIVKGKQLKQNTPLYCFNCGHEGHYGSVCREHRSDRRSFPRWTAVISYLSPEIEKSNLRNKMHRRDLPEMQGQFTPYQPNRPLFVENQARFNQTFPQNGLNPVNLFQLRAECVRQRPIKKGKKKKKANIQQSNVKKNKNGDVLFPRTPKQDAILSKSAARKQKNKKFQKKKKDNKKQIAAQIQLRLRLGLPATPPNHS